MISCPICGGESFPITEFGTGRQVAAVCAECGEAIDQEHADWCDSKYGCDRDEGREDFHSDDGVSPSDGWFGGRDD